MPLKIFLNMNISHKKAIKTNENILVNKYNIIQYYRMKNWNYILSSDIWYNLCFLAFEFKRYTLSCILETTLSCGLGLWMIQYRYILASGERMETKITLYQLVVVVLERRVPSGEEHDRNSPLLQLVCSEMLSIILSSVPHCDSDSAVCFMKEKFNLVMWQ